MKYPNINNADKLSNYCSNVERFYSKDYFFSKVAMWASVLNVPLENVKTESLTELFNMSVAVQSLLHLYDDFVSCQKENDLLRQRLDDLCSKELAGENVAKNISIYHGVKESGQRKMGFNHE